MDDARTPFANLFAFDDLFIAAELTDEAHGHEAFQLSIDDAAFTTWTGSFEHDLVRIPALDDNDQPSLEDLIGENAALFLPIDHQTADSSYISPWSRSLIDFSRDGIPRGLVPPPETTIESILSYGSHTALLGLPSVPAITSSDEPITPKDFMTCLLLLSCARPSPLFPLSVDAKSFEVHRSGTFRCAGISEKLRQEVTDEVLSIGQMKLYLEQSMNDESFVRLHLPTLSVLAASIKSILDVLETRTCRLYHKGSGPERLCDDLRSQAPLLEVLCQTVRMAVRSDDGPQMLSKILSTIIPPSGTIQHYSSTREVLASRICRPAVESVLSACRIVQDGELIANGTDAPEFKDVDLFHYGASQTTQTQNKSTFAFMSPEDRETTTAILNGIEILSKTTDNHPLLLTRDSKLAAEDFGGSRYSIDPDETLARAKLYEREVMSAIEVYRATTARSDKTQRPHVVQIPDLWTFSQLDFHDLAHDMSTYPAANPDWDRDLSEALELDLRNSSDNARVRAGEPHSFSMLTTYRSFLTVQARLVNGAVLRSLLRQEHLLDHFHAHHQFHLLGNGVFLKRLQMTLLDPKHSLTSARALLEGNFCARSDSIESTWPPGRTELWLALAGLFRESYQRRPGPQDAASEHHLNVPGGLNVAVRDADPSARGSVLNPLSAHALDFLRLRYLPSAALSHIFDAATLEKYDDIFRSLLATLRHSHISTGLSAMLTRRLSSPTTDPAGTTARRFAHTCQSVMGALTTHCFSLATAPPWTDFMSAMEQLDLDLEDEDDDDDDEGVYGSIATAGVAGVVALHHHTLDSIKSRLFLAAGQEEVRACIDDVASLMLRATALIGRIVESDHAASPSDTDDDGGSDLGRLDTQLQTAVARLRVSLQHHARGLSARGNPSDASERLWASFGLLPPEDDEGELACMLERALGGVLRKETGNRDQRDDGFMMGDVGR